MEYAGSRGEVGGGGHRGEGPEPACRALQTLALQGLALQTLALQGLALQGLALSEMEFIH